jgi:hypothetical protein
VDCDQAANFIPARIDGELSAGDDAALDAHLAECADCRATHEALAVQDAALLRAFSVRRRRAEAVSERALAVLAQSSGATNQSAGTISLAWRPWSRFVVALAAAAAGFALAILGRGWFDRQPVSRPDLPAGARLVMASGPVLVCTSPADQWRPILAGDDLPASARVRTEGLARCELRLADGSTVRLNENTEAQLEPFRCPEFTGLKISPDPELTDRVSALLMRLARERPQMAPAFTTMVAAASRPSEQTGPSPVEQELRALGERGATIVARWITSDASRSAPTARAIAARVVGDLAPTRSIPELIDFLDDRDAEVRMAALGGLNRLTGHASPQVLVCTSATADSQHETQLKWQKWWQENRERYSSP